MMVAVGLAVWGAVVSCGGAEERQSTAMPNVVIILADDMGYGDVGCLNPDAKVSTPHLDRLAAEGMVFTDAHTPSAVCTPTRYGLLTGRYAWRTRLQGGVLWVWDRPLIEPGRLTLPRLLKRHGYATACIGKWHLGWEWPTDDGSRINDSVPDGVMARRKRILFGKKVDFTKKLGGGPLAAGFDHYFGDDVPNFPPYCFIEDDHVTQLPTSWKPDSMFGFPGPMVPGWRLSRVMPALTRHAVEYIRRARSPFFLYLALTAPHTPIAPAAPFCGSSRAGAYGDYVQEVDWAVGQVMQALVERGLDRNTLVVFTSDNGSPGRDGTGMDGPLNSVLRYGHHPSYIFRGIKSDIWEGGHHVPFLARWPGHIPAGKKSDEVICLTDMMATCAALVGDTLPAGAGEDSYNLLPLFLGHPHEEPLREAIVHHSIDGSFSIRKGSWKLELCPGSGGWSLPNRKALKEGLPEIQLYDLSNDIEERINVASLHPEVVEELSQLLEKYIREGRSTPGPPRENDMEPDAFKWIHNNSDHE